MVLDSLAKSLRDALKRINKSSLVDDRLVEEIVKEMQRALLMADVDVSQFTHLCILLLLFCLLFSVLPNFLSGK